MNDNYIFTEIINDLNAKDIEIYMYDLGVNDIDEKYSENYNTIRLLNTINKPQVIIFHQNYIASFEKIEIWNDIKYINCENRIINCEFGHERKILEKLILKSIAFNMDKSLYREHKNNIYLKEPVPVQNKEFKFNRGLAFDVNVNEFGEIIIGFESKHEIQSVENIVNDLKNGSLKKDDEVKDYLGYTYKFIKEADFTISEVNSYLNKSIKQYYADKKINILEKVNDNLKAVLVETSNKKIYPFSPTLLFRTTSLDNLPSDAFNDFNKIVKLKTDEKVRFTIGTAIRLLKLSPYIKVTPKNTVITNLNYELLRLNAPQLLFGNNNISDSIFKGLKNYGVYQRQSLDIYYFIDGTILLDKNKSQKLVTFCKNLESYSKQIGVSLNCIPMNKEINFRTIDITNPDKFEFEIKEISKKYKGLTIFILEEKYMQMYYNFIKRNFGYYLNIATQGVSFNTVLKSVGAGEKYVFSNILLGIYGKSGIQPWVLKNRLHSDCFIGLDVSRGATRCVMKSYAM